jgi:hypothetical protein
VAEHPPLKRNVGGSNPSGRTSEDKKGRIDKYRSNPDQYRILEAAYDDCGRLLPQSVVVFSRIEETG